jgi:hypothetical protein
MKRIIFISVILWSLASSGQNFSDDIRQLNLTHTTLNLKVQITSNTISEKVIVDRKDLTIASRNSDDYFLSSEDTKMLVRDGLKIMINDDLKVVMIDSNQLDDFSKIPVQFFDSMPGFYSSIKHGFRDGKESYTLVPKVGPTRQVEIYFDRETMLFSDVLVKVEDPYDDETYILHNKYEYTPIGTSDIPGISEFYNTALKKLSPVYQDYELINYLF